MADVAFTIAGRHYSVACKDGEEERLRAMAAMVDERARQASEAVGGKLDEARTLLLAALLLADEVDESAAGQLPDRVFEALEQAAESLETLGERLAAKSGGT